MTIWPTFLAGTNFVMHRRLAGVGLVSCYEKFIVDIEILRMLHEVFKPLEITKETLAYRRTRGAQAGTSSARPIRSSGSANASTGAALLDGDYERWSVTEERSRGARTRSGEDARRVRGAGTRPEAERS